MIRPLCATEMMPVSSETTDHQRITLFCQANGRPVTGAHPTVLGIVRHRQHATGSDDLGIADDDRLVVQGRVGMKDGAQQFSLDVGVDRYAGLDVLLQAGFPLKDDERTVTLAGQAVSSPCHLVDHLLHYLFLLVAGQEAAGTTKALQGSAQLRLKDHGDRDYEGREGIADEPTESLEG